MNYKLTATLFLFYNKFDVLPAFEILFWSTLNTNCPGTPMLDICGRFWTEFVMDPGTEKKCSPSPALNPT